MNIYYIEYRDSIVFYSMENDNKFIMYKNKYTKKQFNKIKHKYNFINLLKNYWQEIKSVV